ncbi:DNA adenine methylase [Knoellia locipacati]|nr:Dam family site-specific DNA-(adenine-N6)-methyltransferase [Knoellia locipacati]
MDSPIRWAGSKRALLPRLRAAMPTDYSRYIEPFAGSACLFFEASPRSAILGDFNGELIRAFQHLQIDVEAVIREIRRWDEDGGDYYDVRALQPNIGSSAEAARFLYLNRFGFNGVYRTNRLGHYNVPRGARTGKLPSGDDWRRVSRGLSTAKLRHQDFKRTIALSRAGDFLYVDPPYVTTARSTYGEYGYGSFESSKMQQLRASLQRADSRGVKIMLSFGSIEGFEDLLEAWTVVEIETTRKIAAKLESRSRVGTEILAVNYSARSLI